MRNTQHRLALLLLVLGIATPANARGQAKSQAPFDSLPGKLIPRVVAESDVTQTFAVYIPSGITKGMQAPVVFVMDPRGRALLAAGLFAPAAEELGYVVISSYNTMSDGPLEPNIAAINAMLRSAPSFSADMSRIYLAGFSGTARLGWDFVLQLGDRAAGYFAVGGAPNLTTAETQVPLRRPDFAFAASAGSADYNFHEVWFMRESLRSLDIPHRAVFFEGVHAWPPQQDVTDVMYWFEARAAMGRRAKLDSAWISARIEDDFARAFENERRGRTLIARDAYADIARNYRGWRQGDSAASRAGRLAARPEVMHTQRRFNALAQEHGARLANTQMEFVRMQLEKNDLTEERVARRINLPQTLARVSRADSLEAPFLRQLLASMHVQLAFYEPRDYIQAYRGKRALVMLRAARMIAPWTEEHCALALEAAVQSGATLDRDVRECDTPRTTIAR